MQFFSSEFDRIAFIFFINEEEKEKIEGQYNNLVMKKNEMICNSDINYKLECEMCY